MVDLRRRRFLHATTAALLATGCSALPRHEDPAAAPRKFHVAIVGGGYGGASVARYLRSHHPEIRVTLIEYNKVYATAPGSNRVIAGLKPFPSILARYRKLQKLGVNLINDWVAAVDSEGHNLRFDDGSRIGYDRLVLAPGVAMNWDAIDGYDEKAAEALPHGWIPGLQTVALASRLRELRRGGVVLLAAPHGDTSCRQAIYERASLIAHHLREHNRPGKLLLLDPLEKSPLRAAFAEVWAELYHFGKPTGLIELVSGRDARVQRVDASARTIFTGAIEERRRADIINIIPPQRAGMLAQAAGLVDASGWCPVDPLTAESKRVAGIHVVGDAAAHGLGRNAVAAREMALRCAKTIAALASERQTTEQRAGADETPEPEKSAEVEETVYSLISPELGLATRRTFRLDGARFTPTGAAEITTGESQAQRAAAQWKRLRREIWG